MFPKIAAGNDHVPCGCAAVITLSPLHCLARHVICALIVILVTFILQVHQHLVYTYGLKPATSLHSPPGSHATCHVDMWTGLDCPCGLDWTVQSPQLCKHTRKHNTHFPPLWNISMNVTRPPLLLSPKPTLIRKRSPLRDRRAAASRRRHRLRCEERDGPCAGRVDDGRQQP